MSKPIFVYNGKCDFCCLWIERWQSLTGEKVSYRPFQEVGDNFRGIERSGLEKAPHFFNTHKEMFLGARAVVELLTYAPRRGWMRWAYVHVPGCGFLAEKFYTLVSSCPSCAFKFTKKFLK